MEFLECWRVAFKDGNNGMIVVRCAGILMCERWSRRERLLEILRLRIWRFENGCLMMSFISISVLDCHIVERWSV